MTTIENHHAYGEYDFYGNDDDHDDDDDEVPNLAKCSVSGGSAVYERVPSHTRSATTAITFGLQHMI